MAQTRKEEAPDLIQLHAFGQLSVWKFPTTSNDCPIEECGRSFGNRAEAIDHFKKDHAMISLLCLVCNMPICARDPNNYFAHHNKYHSNIYRLEPSSFGFDNIEKSQAGQEIQPQGSEKENSNVSENYQNVVLNKSYGNVGILEEELAEIEEVKPIMQENSNIELTNVEGNAITPNRGNQSAQEEMAETEDSRNSAENEESEDEDDLITLTGLGWITQWRFPKDLLNCPVSSCGKEFNTRSAAISHYKKNHAEKSILCSICDEPIYVRFSIAFKKHYQKFHPNEELPRICDEDETQKLIIKIKEEVQENNSTSQDDDDDPEDVITLRACGQTTQWSFPPHLKKCPVRRCCIEFGTRSETITHYKEQHAKNSIYCSLCDKPLCVNGPKHFILHYKSVHPNECQNFVPMLFDKNEMLQLKRILRKGTQENNSVSQTDDDDDEDDDEDDLITLSGCGRKTRWRFPPNLKLCPVRFCRTEFGIRSDAIAHYKKQHAKTAVLCTICDKPICASNQTNLRAHYQRVHPSVKVPQFSDKNEIPQLNQTLPKETQKDYSISQTDDDEDLITLSACGQVTQWRFPRNLQKCPVQRCHTAFGTRSEAITHYKEQHAMKSIYCSLCDKPLCIHAPKYFVIHYKKMHPNVKLPEFFDPNEIRPEQMQKNNSVSQSDDDNCDDDVHDDDVDENDLITLNGCGLVTKWRFPPNLKKCPVLRCDVEFGSKSDGITHYKKQHAENSILCIICDKPICSQDWNNFKRHNKSIHSNLKLPKNINEYAVQILEKKILPEKKANNSISQSDDDDDDEDDLIMLNACGQMTQWRFPPNLKHCPARLCRREFGTRSDAIIHYKEKHAENAMLCSICDKPIFVNCPANFKRHFQYIHPNVELPNIFSAHEMQQLNQTLQDEMQENNSISQSDDDDDDEDDLITLSACGQITQWRFPPNLKHCPVKKCLIKFGIRSDAISHYKKRHAMNSIYCSLCDKPCCIYKPSDFGVHYKKVHPGQKIPFNFDKTTKMGLITQNECGTSKINNDDLITLSGCGLVTQWHFPQNLKACPVKSCRIGFGTRSNALNHFKKEHAKNSILCSICNKPICVNCPTNFKKHLRKIHPHVKLPKVFDKHEMHQLNKTLQHEMHENDSISQQNFLANDEDDDEDDHADDEDKEDDLITLSAFGQVTQWRFPPYFQKCPVQRCHIEFKTRSEAIIHYKELHATNSIYCSLCDKPRSVHRLKDFKLHYERVHPGEKMPFNFDKATEQPNNSITRNESDTSEIDEDDLITLSGCGKTSKWRFPPNSKECPVVRCRGKRFANRSAAIMHYKNRHAANSVYCNLCGRPICSYNMARFKAHCRRMHSKSEALKRRIVRVRPNERRPLQLTNPKDIQTRCKICNKSFINIRRHIQEVHNSKTILCPLNKCNFVAKRVYLLREHWLLKHRNLRFPEIRKESDFTYATSQASNPLKRRFSNNSDESNVSDGSEDDEMNQSPSLLKPIVKRRRKASCLDEEMDM